jgi:large subunit ribosomal protein L28
LASNQAAFLRNLLTYANIFWICTIISETASSLKGETSLATRCDLCGRHPVSGHNVSHSERKTKRRWRPNIQKTHVFVEGESHTAFLCTRCMRTLAKTEA